METAEMAEEFFASAAWQAIRQLYPRATVKGCVFHWNQRVYRKVVNEGLATAYAANGDKFLFLRKLMSLPYLPSEHIIPAFEHMLPQAEEVLIIIITYLIIIYGIHINSMVFYC
ncbi:hypothetical protein DPMN_120415 [Dreissena polymorpha]|uniref:MULE transposase domain-containing protein n=1 Tax=Dreissena polymorpha TaxID=45954 RepID=A0A9D4GKT4_DREPO|nr:hypothetical protein DPMN_120415 [Dreissena polymorpha]